MIRGLLARFTLFVTMISSLLTLVKSEFAWATASLALLLVWLVAHGQRGMFVDGWNAAHDHHQIPCPEKHFEAYRNFIARAT